MRIRSGDNPNRGITIDNDPRWEAVRLYRRRAAEDARGGKYHKIAAELWHSIHDDYDSKVEK